MTDRHPAGNHTERYDWFGRLEPVLFYALLLLHLLPLLMVTYLPTQDGPSHLYNAMIIREYDWPQREAFRTFFMFTPELVPNWFSHATLAALMTLLPPLVAEKVLVGGYVVAFPLAFRYAVKGVNRDAAFVSLLAFPFVYNFLTMAGFYNWVWSLVLMFVIVGYWLRRRNAMTWKHVAALLPLVLLMHFMHIISVAMTCLLIAMLSAVETATDLVAQRRNGRADWAHVWRRFRSRALMPAAAFAPSIALIAVFILNRTASQAEHLPTDRLIRELWGLGALLSITSRLHSPLIELHYMLDRYGTWLQVLRWLLIAAAGYRLVRCAASRRLRVSDGLLLVAALFAGMYMLMPDELATGSFISPRLAIYALLALLLWLAAGTWDRWSRRVAGLVAVGIAGALLWGNAARMTQLDSVLAEYASGARHIDADATVFPISRAHWGSRQHGTGSTAVAVYLHADSYLTLASRAVNLKNYEAATGHFPVMYRPAVDPYRHMAVGGTEMLEGMIPRIDIAAYEQHTGKTVDYVTVWHAPPPSQARAAWKSVQRQIDARYEPVYTSTPRGLLQVYRRRR